MIIHAVRRDIRKRASKRRASVLRRYFKTGPGEYAEGDVFLGVTVPALREIAARRADGITLGEIRSLLQSAVHEERFLALLFMVGRFENGTPPERKRIYRLYFRNTHFVNNWDLVDVSAPGIAGAFLEKRSREPLYRLAESMNMWDRRIAMVATLRYIRLGECAETLGIARVLLHDEESLIHKAAGWMLREAGKRHARAVERFLDKHCLAMPRTMLRYALERFPPSKRARYLRRNGKCAPRRPKERRPGSRPARSRGHENA